MPKVVWKEASRCNWNSEHPSDFPGLARLQVACLQRIADATEAMAKNHQKLINERDLYQRWYKEGQAEIARLQRSNNALRGHLKRAKAGAK